MNIKKIKYLNARMHFYRDKWCFSCRTKSSLSFENDFPLKGKPILEKINGDKAGLSVLALTKKEILFEINKFIKKESISEVSTWKDGLLFPWDGKI